ncbi:MAG: bestrophin family ion channel [Legionellaceae bacterium]|nr:bestrophin family ion channel [Legionellaceae bacterium]
MSSKKHLENTHEYPSFLKTAFAIHGSVTPKVMKLLAAILVYASITSFLHNIFLWDSIPISPFEYAGLVMGLILVFRINAGYDRWWEARKLWGSVVNNSRNLAIVASSYSKGIESSKLRQLVGYIAAVPFLMKNHLRHDDSVDEVAHLVDLETHQALPKYTHKPNFLSKKIAFFLSQWLEGEHLDQFAFLQAERCREAVIDCQGACERILKTPMPFVMAIKSRRFILLFLLMMPVALAEYSLALNLLVTAIVGYALLALDQIGVELQNPFSKDNLSHLPIDTICKTIEKDVVEIFEGK